MRKLSISEDNITRRMKNCMDSKKINIAKDEGVYVENYNELVKEIAELSYLNQDYMLFFRGQVTDYKNRNLSTTLYPTIYRDERIIKSELRYKFDVLDTASNLLVKRIEDLKKNDQIIGSKELKRKKQVQWSILQHYEVCSTPLIDVTHSLRVACSFAMLDNNNDFCYIYVLALPYLTGRISINSEHDIINIRLLSISPPQALRPFFQEGYLVGSEYISDDYESKNELDFNRRLVAKYKIPNNTSFWGKNIDRVEKNLLYPENDVMLAMCDNIKKELNYEVVAGDRSIGNFLFYWNELESYLRNVGEGQYNIYQSMIFIKNKSYFSDETINKLDLVRKFRNNLVHNINEINQKDVLKYNVIIRELLNELRNFNEEEIAASSM